jgi:hypothetical protein
MSAEGTVYLVQEPPPIRTSGGLITKDLSSAHRYGKLLTILTAQDQASLTPGPILNKLTRELHEFNPRTDFICFAGGDPMSLALALLALRNMNYSEVQTLRWDRARSIDGRREPGGYYVNVNTPLRP